MDGSLYCNRHCLAVYFESYLFKNALKNVVEKLLFFFLKKRKMELVFCLWRDSRHGNLDVAQRSCYRNRYVIIFMVVTVKNNCTHSIDLTTCAYLPKFR
jgi:hypothetical protein